MTAPPADFGERAAALGATLDDAQVDRLQDYLQRLLSTNERMNLTTVRDADTGWTRHILDSLALVPDLASVPADSEVADIGSGGGLPAIPLAILRPDLRFTLVEATGKKAAFLEETGREMGLPIQVRADRLEDFGRGEGRERFEAVTSRALAALPVLLEYTAPLLKVGGCCLAIKGERASEELQQAASAMATLSMELTDRRSTPTGTILVLTKTAPTEARFPRRPGVPKKRPL